MGFQYEKNQIGMTVTAVEEDLRVVLIPEMIEGVPVTELGAYALSGKCVEELYLPSSLRKIGAYALYNCERLKKLSCDSRTTDLGAGLFTGCRNVERLEVVMHEGEKSSLKELLSELRMTLRVQLTGDVEAKLIFPEFFEEMVENTPARILEIHTHGCGHRYRYCFQNTVFQFHGYDEVFPHVKVQESEDLVTELVLGRLWYPCGLQEDSRKAYEAYLREHLLTAARLLLMAERGQAFGVHPEHTNLEQGRLGWLTEQFVIDASQLEEMISLAQKVGNQAVTGYLMNRLHEIKEESGAGARQEQVHPSGVASAKKRRFDL